MIESICRLLQYDKMYCTLEINMFHSHSLRLRQRLRWKLLMKMIVYFLVAGKESPYCLLLPFSPKF